MGLRVLVTGGDGLLGQALKIAGQEQRVSVRALGHRQLDVVQASAVDREIEDCNPDLVINCAAFTDVLEAEVAGPEPWLVNEVGAHNLAVATARRRIPLIYVSTDYVFDGRKFDLYYESDPGGPAKSVYGLSKLAGEHQTLYTNPQSWVVRSAALFGPGGKNFVDTILAKAEVQEQISVFGDQVTSPTYSLDLARRLLTMATGADRRPSGIYHLVGSEPCSWAELAEATLELTGSKTEIDWTSLRHSEQYARRPLISALGTEHENWPLLAPWPNSLRRYLGSRDLIATERADKLAEEARR